MREVERGREGGREREREVERGREREREAWRERETIQVTQHYTIQTYPHIYSTVHRIIVSRYRLTIIPLKGRSVVATAGKQYHHTYTLNDSVLLKDKHSLLHFSSICISVPGRIGLQVCSESTHDILSHSISAHYIHTILVESHIPQCLL